MPASGKILSSVNRLRQHCLQRLNESLRQASQRFRDLHSHRFVQTPPALGSISASCSTSLIFVGGNGLDLCLSGVLPRAMSP